MARPHIGLDNWFLVIPGALLGLVALYTVNQMYRAGDIRRSIEVITTYQVEGQAPLQQFVAAAEGALECRAAMVSYFYGTLDVSCVPRDSGTEYNWRVHVGQRAFAPADATTLDLMRRYAPEVFDSRSVADDGDH